MDYLVLGAVGYFAYYLIYNKTSGTPNSSNERSMNVYSAKNEVRAASSYSRSNALFDQLTLEDNRNVNLALGMGNPGYAINLQGMFVKNRAMYPQQSFAQKSKLFGNQTFQQTLPAGQRSMFNINWSRLPSAQGDQKPGFFEKNSKHRNRLYG